MLLRREKLWLSIGIGFVCLVVYLSLMAGPLGVPESLKLGHLLAYGGLVLWFAQIYRAPRRRWRLAGVLFALGIVGEYLQRLTGYRGFEYSDMVINAAGVTMGLTLAQSRLQHGLRLLERLLPAR